MRAPERTRDFPPPPRHVLPPESYDARLLGQAPTSRSSAGKDEGGRRRRRGGRERNERETREGGNLVDVEHANKQSKAAAPEEEASFHSDSLIQSAHAPKFSSFPKCSPCPHGPTVTRLSCPPPLVFSTRAMEKLLLNLAPMNLSTRNLIKILDFF